MKIISTISEMQSLSDSLKKENKKIACVPTMGSLHQGHLSLVKKAAQIADIVVTTLFVNPTQFGPNEDYSLYPRDIEKDAKLCQESGVDVLFCPEVLEMYPIGFNSNVQVNNVTEPFEGERRPGHFDGVALIVAKLFNAVRPHIAIFGQKDYQQTLVIKKMAKDLNFGIDIVIAPTVRASDGLALSSRNAYLSEIERSKAVILFQALEEAKTLIMNGCRERKVINATLHKTLRSVPEIKLDYASAASADELNEPDVFFPGELIVILIAVYLGKTRLIDNALVTIPNKKPF